MAKSAAKKTGKPLPPVLLLGASAFLRPVRLAFVLTAETVHIGTTFILTAYPFELEDRTMLVERGVRVMNMGVVGDAYDIAVNYLRRSGVIPDDLNTNDRLLEIIVKMFHRGEINKIRLANLAIARFEALESDNLA